MFPWFPCIDDIDAHVSLRDFPACHGFSVRCRGTGAPPTDSIVVPQVKVLVNITGTQWKPVTPGEWAMGCFRHGELREFTDQQRKGGLICHSYVQIWVLLENCLYTHGSFSEQTDESVDRVSDKPIWVWVGWWSPFFWLVKSCVAC